MFIYLLGGEGVALKLHGGCCHVVILLMREIASLQAPLLLKNKKHRFNI